MSIAYRARCSARRTLPAPAALLLFPNDLWVDPSQNTDGIGTMGNPFNQLTSALNAATEDADTIRIKYTTTAIAPLGWGGKETGTFPLRLVQGVPVIGELGPAGARPTIRIDTTGSTYSPWSLPSAPALEERAYLAADDSARVESLRFDGSLFTKGKTTHLPLGVIAKNVSDFDIVNCEFSDLSRASTTSTPGPFSSAPGASGSSSNSGTGAPRPRRPRPCSRRTTSPRSAASRRWWSSAACAPAAAIPAPASSWRKRARSPGRRARPSASCPWPRRGPRRPGCAATPGSARPRRARGSSSSACGSIRGPGASSTRGPGARAGKRPRAPRRGWHWPSPTRSSSRATHAARPFERALALASSREEEDLRRALELFRALGASPAAKLVERRLRERGARGIPRGERATTRANPAG